MIQFKQVLFAIALAFMVALFVGLAVDAFYEEPKYEDFCEEGWARVEPVVVNYNSCNRTVSKEELACNKEHGMVRYKQDEQGCNVFDYCDYCNLKYDEARRVYNRNVFLILAPLGLVAIVFGLLYGLEFIANGFMLSGIFILFYATLRYFSDMDKFLRLGVIFVELLLLVWVGYKKLRK